MLSLDSLFTKLNIPTTTSSFLQPRPRPHTPLMLQCSATVFRRKVRAQELYVGRNAWAWDSRLEACSKLHSAGSSTYVRYTTCATRSSQGWPSTIVSFSRTVELVSIEEFTLRRTRIVPRLTGSTRVPVNRFDISQAAQAQPSHPPLAAGGTTAYGGFIV